jgi:hypothetical protein
VMTVPISDHCAVYADITVGGVGRSLNGE